MSREVCGWPRYELLRICDFTLSIPSRWVPHTLIHLSASAGSQLLWLKYKRHHWFTWNNGHFGIALNERLPRSHFWCQLAWNELVCDRWKRSAPVFRLGPVTHEKKAAQQRLGGGGWASSCDHFVVILFQFSPVPIYISRFITCCIYQFIPVLPLVITIYYITSHVI